MKINKRKKAVVLTVSYLSATVIALGILAGTNYQRAETYKRYVAANYQHAFGELVTAVSEMDTALQKSLYATSPSMVSAVCTEVFGKAMTAQMSLGVLPFSTQELEQTAGFISRVGDYAFALSKSAGSGAGYTDEEKKNLKSLSETANLLASNMKSLQTDLMDGVLTRDELEDSQDRLDAAEQSMPNTLGGSMRLIEQEFPEIPSLVYDGPFSEHITKQEPVTLKGAREVSEDEARDAAAQFSGVSRSKLYLAGECGGNLPCYFFEANVGSGTLSLKVTKQGGKVINMLSSRQPGEGELSDDEVLKSAYKFLDGRGYTDMVETYRIRQNNVVTINFAYRQDKVVCYSDLVKVAVAEDTGAVCGFEAQGYLMTHCRRDLPLPAVSEEQAREKVPDGLEVLSSQLALVPSDGKYEKLCYEFKCSDENERHCLIYVGADSGEQEKILILIEDETGALTI